MGSCAKCTAPVSGVGRIARGGAILCKPCYADYLATGAVAWAVPERYCCAICERWRGGKLRAFVDRRGNRGLVCWHPPCLDAIGPAVFSKWTPPTS